MTVRNSIPISYDASWLCPSAPSTAPSTSPSTSPSSNGALSVLPAFIGQNPWNTDISSAPVDPDSSAITAWLAAAGNFGRGRLEIDASINYLLADCTTPKVTFTPKVGYYSPDCDALTSYEITCVFYYI